MLLELKDIKKYFYDRPHFLRPPVPAVRAIDGVSLSVRQGENFGLVGESGSGKTTLAKVILQLVKAHEGTILFDGKKIEANSSECLKNYRKNVQMVFQDPYNSLDPRLTVRRALAEALTLEPSRQSVSERDDRMRKLLESVGLPGSVLNRYPHEFSGGERQRIAIARALLPRPQLVVLDEAVSSLDVIVQKQLIDLLLELQKRFQLTYFFISHNLKVVRWLCPKIAVMYRGKIVEVASAEDIFRDPLHPYTKALLSAATTYKTDGSIPEKEFPDGAKLVERGQGHYVLESE